jgi:tetraacyldisaccharide 4'-kinase
MKFIRTIISWIYTLVVIIRHRLYDWGVLKSISFDIPIVCVGNITVGGTGKTPTVEYLLSVLSDRYNIAVLSRGYGRQTQGYREVTVQDSYRDVGDEPLLLKLKFPNNPVVVCEDRVAGIERIRKEHPDVNLIVMDDGFQHRRVKAKVNLILIDSTRPIASDKMLPLGRLRDIPSRLQKAHIFIVTKCSTAMSPIDRRLWTNKLRSVAYQKIFFSRYHNTMVEPLFYFKEREEIDYGRQAIIVTGIGNPRPFIKEAETRFSVVEKLIYRDHHSFTAEDMKHLCQLLDKYPRAIVLMTEKDAVRLRRAKLPQSLMRAMYYQPIAMRFIDGPDHNFVNSLISEIEYGKKHTAQEGEEEATKSGDMV